MGQNNLKIKLIASFKCDLHLPSLVFFSIKQPMNVQTINKK